MPLLQDKKTISIDFIGEIKKKTKNENEAQTRLYLSHLLSSRKQPSYWIATNW